MQYINTMEYYSTIKKNEIMPFAATWMDPEIIISQSNTERQVSYDTTYMWNLKKGTSEVTYKREMSDRCRKQTYGYQEIRGERDKSGDCD